MPGDGSRARRGPRMRQVIVEHGPGGWRASFAAPREVVTARTPEEVLPALQRLDAARAEGAWAAGWIAYEAGAAFEPRLSGVMRGAGPLLCMGLFDGPTHDVQGQPGPVTLSAPEPLIARAA